MSDVYLWETYDKLGREALDSGNLQQAHEAFRSAVATAEELQLPDRLVLSLRNLAATMFDMNQVSDAHELLMRTLDVANQQLGAEHSQTVETQRDLSQLCQQLGYLDKADELLKAVLQQELKSQATDRIGSTLLTLAQIAQARKEPVIAAAYLQRVVKLKTQQLGDDHPEVAQALLWLSTALYQCGKNDEAQTNMRRAFGMMERQFADEPAHLAQSLLAGAKMMVDSGQAEAALVHQKRALDILSSTLDPNDNKLWETREYIATTLAALGKLEEAIEVLELCFREGEPTGARAGATFKNLAGLYLALDKKEKAEELYGKASTILAESLGEEHPAYLATQEERIQLYHFSGRSKEALDIALRTIKATERRFGAGHPNTAQAYASTALLAHGAEEWNTALELMRAAEKIWMSLTPRPEDVLANCRTNLATCLIKLKRFDEADPILQQAEMSAGPKLAPVVAELRAELDAERSKTETPPVPAPVSAADAPTITEAPPTPTVEDAPGIVIEEPSSAAEDSPEDEPADAEQDDFDGGIDLFAPIHDDIPEEARKVSPNDEPTLKVQTVAVPPATEAPSSSGDTTETNPFEIEPEEQEFPDPFAIDPVEELPPTPAPEDSPPDPFATEFEEELPPVPTIAMPDEEQPFAGGLEEEPVPSIPVGEEELPLSDSLEEELPPVPSIPVASHGPPPPIYVDGLEEELPPVPSIEIAEEELPANEDFSVTPDSEDDLPPAPSIELADEEFSASSLSEDSEDEPTPAPSIEVAEDSEGELFPDPVDIQMAEPDILDDPLEDDESASDLFGSDDGDESFEDESAPPPFASESGEDLEPVAERVEAETSDPEPSLTPEPPAAEPESSEESGERRASPRSPLSFNRFFNVTVEVDGDAADELKSYLVDLSLGGIRINSENPFPQESEISISLPEGVLGEEVTLQAEVIWQKALYGASYIQGIAFRNLSSYQQDLISKQLRPENAGRNASRQHFRLYRPFPIKLKAQGQEDWVASYATDLSVNGLGTRLKAPLEQGNPIRIRLELEFELPAVEVEARVAWSKSGENGVSHGLQFATVGPVEARTIKRYIDRCLEFLPD